MRGLPASRFGISLFSSSHSLNNFSLTAGSVQKRPIGKRAGLANVLRAGLSLFTALILAPNAHAVFSNAPLEFGAVMVNTQKCNTAWTWENITPGNTQTTICDKNGCQTGWKYAEVSRSVSFTTNNYYTPNSVAAPITFTPSSASNIAAFGTVNISNFCITPLTTGDYYSSVTETVSPAYSNGATTETINQIHVKGIQALLQAEPLGGSLYYGTVYINQSSTQSFNVYNYSGSAITISSITTGNSNFVVTSGVNQSVPANGTSPVAVNVKFQPGSTGSFSGNIQVNTTGGNVTYPYSGTGANLPTPTVTTSSNGNGTVTPASSTVQYGGNLSITITPAAGYTMSSLIDNGVDVTGSTILQYGDWAYYLTNITSNHSIQANFISGTMPTPPAAQQVPAFPPIAGLILASGIGGIVFWRKKRTKKDR